MGRRTGGDRAAALPSGDVVLRARERDRAFYILLDGRLEVEGSGVALAPPAALGVAAFLDDQPRAVTCWRAATASWRA